MSYPIVDAVLIPVGTRWRVVAVFRGPGSANKASVDAMWRYMGRHRAFFDGPRKMKVGMTFDKLPQN